MDSFNNIYINNLNDTITYLYRYVIPVLYIIGNIGNFLSALIFSKKAWRKNVCVFYFNICLFFNSCYINSSVLQGIFFGLNINLQNSNRILCKLYYYATFLFAALYPTILILASIDRLLISSQNVDTRLYSSKRLACFSVSICTGFWIIFYIHIPIKFDIQEIFPSYFICSSDPSYTYRQFISYFSLIINCIHCLAMISFCIFTYKNVQHIRIVPRQQRKEIRTMTKKDFQLLRCLFVQDIIYIIFSIGLSIVAVYQAATIFQIPTSLEQAINLFFTMFTIFLHHIPYCINFFIFMIVSKAFRHELKRMAYKIYGKEVIVSREEENRHENIGTETVEINVIAVVNRID